MLATQFGLLVLVSFCTRPYDLSAIGPFYARIHTPVGKEDEVRWDDPPHDLPEAATLGLDGVLARLPQVFAIGLPAACNGSAWKSRVSPGSTGGAFSPPGSSSAA